MSRIRSRVSYANVVATLALFVALGGSATAAVLVTGKNVKDSSLTGKDVKNNALGSLDVKDGDLLAKDFKAGQLPTGPKGLQGPQGVKGETGDKGDKGDTGTVDTSNFYTKGQSDGRYLQSTVTVVKTIANPVDAGSYAGAFVECPSGYQAIGGGVDVNQIWYGKVSSSNPTFGGNRMFTQPDGQQGPATGWFGAVTMQGTTVAGSEAKVAVICAPIG